MKNACRALVHVMVALFVAVGALLLTSCKASGPGRIETDIATEAKKISIGGKDVKNPIPDTPEAVKTGAEHFQHHCMVCHGLDGHNTGVPFADKMAPKVADLGQKRVQDYTDGQLKWIMDNGIRFTGMPSWKGILDDDEMWHIVHYLRHLPPQGSAGIPAVYKESEEEHAEMESGGKQDQQQPKHEHAHKH